MEQEKLNQEITDLSAELATLNARLEGNENRLKEILRQKETSNKNLSELTSEIEKMRKENPKNVVKRKDMELKNKELESLELQRRKFYLNKIRIQNNSGKIGR